MLHRLRLLLPAVLLGTGCVSIPFDHPHDSLGGEGGIIASPEEVEAPAETRIRFTFTVGRSGLFQGGGFRVQLPVDPVHRFLGFTPPHTGNRHRSGHVQCASRRGDSDIRPAVAEVGPAGEMRCLLDAGSLRPGETLLLEYWGLMPRVSGSYGLHAESRVSGGRGGRPMSRQPALEVRPRPARFLQVLLPSVAVSGRPFALFLRALDDFGNVDRSYSGTVRIALGSLAIRRTLGPEDDGMALIDGLVLHETGFAWATVRSEGAGAAVLEARSNPVRVVAGPEGDPVFWGDLHFHTGSGAAGRGFLRADVAAGDHRGNYTGQEAAYLYARDVMRLDFAAATEHAVAGFTEEAWSLSNLRANVFDNPPSDPLVHSGRFTAFAGYHWRDRLVLFAGGEAPLVRGDDRLGDEPAELEAALALLDPDDFLMVGLGEPGPGVEAVELYSWKNRGEGYDDRSRRFEPGPEWLGDAIPRALMASSASHWGHPGVDDLTGLEPGAGGLTAVRAERNDRVSVMAALKRGDVWATTGARIYLSVEPVIGSRGSGVKAGDQLRILAAGTALLEAASLVVIQKTGSREEALLPEPAESLDTVVTVPATDGPAFCYLRVVQRNGELAWSSPIRLDPMPQ